MNVSPFVLLYGRDSQLLKTREWILETIGCRSQIVGGFDEFQARLRDRSLSLTVICHSIPSHETEAAILAVHRVRPDLKILTLVATPSGVRKRRDGEQIVDIHEGPGGLVEAVQQIMKDGSMPPQSLPYPPGPKVMRLPVTLDE